MAVRSAARSRPPGRSERPRPDPLSPRRGRQAGSSPAHPHRRRRAGGRRATPQGSVRAARAAEPGRPYRAHCSQASMALASRRATFSRVTWVRRVTTGRNRRRPSPPTSAPDSRAGVFQRPNRKSSSARPPLPRLRRHDQRQGPAAGRGDFGGELAVSPVEGEHARASAEPQDVSEIVGLFRAQGRRRSDGERRRDMKARARRSLDKWTSHNGRSRTQPNTAAL